MTPTDGVFLEPQPVHREAAWLESAPTGETRQMRGFVLHKRDSCMIHAGENMGTLYVTGECCPLLLSDVWKLKRV